MKSKNHPSLRCFIALLLLCPLSASALGPMKTFTDANGRKILASFVAARGDEVIIQTTDGRQHVLKTASLSLADQQYVITRGGKVGETSGAAPRPTPSSPAPAQAIGNGNHGGMALADGWMPLRTETKRELLEGITFYAKAVLGDAAPGKEPIPGELSTGITWLMPFDQVLAKLPERVIKMGERAVNNNAFPVGSLTIASFQYKSFQDQGKPFNLIHLILDAKRQVVGVQFVQQTPGKNFVYEAEGKLEPYYNFLTLTNNASSGKEVVYAILPGQSNGVKCIQTVFRDADNNITNGLPQIPGKPGGGPGMLHGMPMVNRVTPGAMNRLVKVHEVCHWYLAAPFARCLIEIAEKNGVRSN